MANGPATLVEDERRLREVDRPQRAAARPPVVGRGDGHLRIGAEGRRHELSSMDRQRQHGDVELARRDGRRQVGGVAGDDHEFELGMARAEPAQRIGQQIRARGGARAEPHASGHDTAQPLDRLARRLELGQRAARVLEQHLAGGGGKRPAADALEQARAQRRLQVPDVMAHRGLAHVQRLGRARERGVAHDLGERPDVDGRQLHRSRSIANRLHSDNSFPSWARAWERGRHDGDDAPNTRDDSRRGAR